jgi:deoxyribonuclease IV
VLIGAHVSTAGGLAKAVERGVEMGADSIQIFNQSPRMWRPTRYSEDDFAACREAMDGSRVEAVVIHAVYLINCATQDQSMRRKSLTSLTQALRIGDGIGAAGVVIHPGAQKGSQFAGAMRRAGKLMKEALAEADRCPLLLEQTAGHKGLLGRDFDEIVRLIELAGGNGRLGLCLDSCHLFVQGFDIGDEEKLSAVLDEADERVGLDRLRCVHVNDAGAPLGSCRDRHANIGDGEMGRHGLAAFLSEPRFEGLPATLEVPGPDNRGPNKREVDKAKRLRTRGLRRRGAKKGGRARARSRRSS